MAIRLQYHSKTSSTILSTTNKALRSLNKQQQTQVGKNQVSGISPIDTVEQKSRAIISLEVGKIIIANSTLKGLSHDQETYAKKEQKSIHHPSSFTSIERERQKIQREEFERHSRISKSKSLSIISNKAKKVMSSICGILKIRTTNNSPQSYVSQEKKYVNKNQSFVHRSQCNGKIRKNNNRINLNFQIHKKSGSCANQALVNLKSFSRVKRQLRKIRQ